MPKSTFDYPQSSALVGKMLLAVYKPLARILIRLRVPYSQAAELLKWTMVHGYSDHNDSVSGSVSELALRTGLCRKEVKKLLEVEAPIGRQYPRRHERIPAIIHGWLNDPRFADMPGTPRALKLRGSKGSFQDLVSHYGADVPYTVIARELLDANVALMSSSDMVQLDVEKVVGALPLAPNEAIWDCVMHVQTCWEEICGEHGELPAIRLQGPAPSLEAFVADYSGDVSPESVRLELVSAGYVAIDGNVVTVVNPAYVPSNTNILFETGCQNIGNFLSTVEHNLGTESREGRLLQHELDFAGLTARDRAEFEATVRSEMDAVKSRLTERFAARQFRETGVPIIGVGTYLFRMPNVRRITSGQTSTIRRPHISATNPLKL